MRRKILQHFSDVCCQMFITSLRNYDRINFVLFGSGVVEIDFLTQRCTHNHIGISPLFYCIEYRDWLEKNCSRNRIAFSALLASRMTVEMTVNTFRNQSGMPGWMDTSINFNCSSLIATDEKDYVSNSEETVTMGLGQILHDRLY